MQMCAGMRGLPQVDRQSLSKLSSHLVLDHGWESALRHGAVEQVFCKVGINCKACVVPHSNYQIYLT